MKTLLIVDDHDAIREGVAMVFEAKSDTELNILQAPDGRKALELAKDHKLDVAIVDLMMPEMDGHTLSKKLKAQFPNCVIYMLTAKTDPQTSEKIENSKAVDYLLTKPIDNNQLYEKVKPSLA